MIAAILGGVPRPDRKRAYLDAAAALRPRLETFDGLISIERFETLVSPGKVLSVSYWRDEEAVRRWRDLEAPRHVQAEGRKNILPDYRLRVAQVVRGHGLNDRLQPQDDSQQVHAG